ncbi:MAG: YraN family protein [Pseudomonadota bacterium]
MADRRAAERRGRRGELLAAAALALKGYSILERRAKTKVGEIDLIARRGRLLAIIEVKARPTPEDCLDAVTPKAWRRIEQATRIWIARRPIVQTYEVRFDVVAVTPRRWPKHFRGAWRPDFAPTGF